MSEYNKTAEIGFTGLSPNYIAEVKIRVNEKEW